MKALVNGQDFVRWVEDDYRIPEGLDYMDLMSEVDLRARQREGDIFSSYRSWVLAEVVNGFMSIEEQKIWYLK